MPNIEDPKLRTPGPEAPVDPSDYRRPPIPFTYQRRMAFLQALRQCGFIYRAAEMVGVSISCVTKARKEEPEFGAAVDEARHRWTEDHLIPAALRRAVDGVDKPIIGGQFKDEIVAYEKVYSDSLMALFLKALKPEFREGAADAAKYQIANAGVVVIPAGPATPEAWEATMGDLANPKAKPVPAAQKVGDGNE